MSARSFVLETNARLAEKAVLAGDAALEKSVRIATADAGADAEAESYELALTLEAVDRLSELRGEEENGAGEKSEAIFGRLGVVSRPSVPLPRNGS